MVTAGRLRLAPAAPRTARDSRCSSWSSAVSSISDDAIVGRQERRERVQQRRLAGAGAAADQDVLRPAAIAVAQRREHVRRHRADPHQFLGGEEPRLELANRQRRAADAARREDGGHARAVRQARVEDRLSPRRRRRRARGRCSSRRRCRLRSSRRTSATSSQQAVALDEDPSRAVDHDLADVRVLDQVRDRPEKRQDDVEAHYRAPFGGVIEVAGLDVEVVRLEVAVRRRLRIEAVVRQDDRLRVLELGEDLRLEHVVEHWRLYVFAALTVVRCAAGRPVSMLTRASCPASVIV